MSHDEQSSREIHACQASERRFAPRNPYPWVYDDEASAVAGSCINSVHVNGGEACAIDESTRPSLLLAAELLGVDSDRLEQAVVSKTMAVSVARSCRCYLTSSSRHT